VLEPAFAEVGGGQVFRVGKEEEVCCLEFWLFYSQLFRGYISKLICLDLRSKVDHLVYWRETSSGLLEMPKRGSLWEDLG